MNYLFYCTQCTGPFRDKRDFRTFRRDFSGRQYKYNSRMHFSRRNHLGLQQKLLTADAL